MPFLLKYTVWISAIICLFGCSTEQKIILPSSSEQISNSSKFEPEDGRVLLFVGQDLEATGGLEDFSRGYSDYFDTPAGVTVYTNFSPGDQSYSRILRGNDGIKEKANWGSGYNCAQCYIEDETYQNSIISIGLSLVNHEKAVANGKRDYLIQELGNWIKSIRRPVFLRIGYEFDGWEWNHYSRKNYLKAWKRIHSKFSEMGITNVAFVWQSKGTGSDQDTLEDWYPGNEFVDWCAYSYFSNPDEEMIKFARRYNKPVFIAEATPVLANSTSYLKTDLSDSAIAKQVWNEWFESFFNTIENNKDVIKAFSYINSDWTAQPMWEDNPVFQNVDSRIQESVFITQKWRAELNNPMYLKASSSLFKNLSK